MDRDNKYYEIIKEIVQNHKKFAGLEDILEDIIDDVYSHSKVIISSIDDEAVLNSYLEKVVSTSIITVPKRLKINSVARTSPSAEEIISKAQSEIKVDKALVDKMINGDIKKEQDVMAFDIQDSVPVGMPEEHEADNSYNDLENIAVEDFSEEQEVLVSDEYNESQVEPDSVDNISENLDILFEDNNVQVDDTDVKEEINPLEINNSDKVNEVSDEVDFVQELEFVNSEIDAQEEPVNTESLLQEADGLEEIEALKESEDSLNQDVVFEEAEDDESSVYVGALQCELSDENKDQELDIVVHEQDEILQKDLIESSEEYSADIDSELDLNIEADLSDDLGETENSESLLEEGLDTDADLLSESELAEDLDKLLITDNESDFSGLESNSEVNVELYGYSAFSSDIQEEVSINAQSIINDIKNLDDKYPDKNIKTIFELKYKEGMTIARIAANLNCTESDIINALTEMTDTV